MNDIKQIKKKVILLSLFGFVFALLLSGLTLRIGMLLETSGGDTNFSGSVMYLYQDMVSRYFFISLCFLLFFVFLLISNRLFFKLINIIPLAIILLQSSILITSKKDRFQDEIWDYPKWIGISYFVDVCLLILTIILLILQFRLIRAVYQSSVYN